MPVVAIVTRTFGSPFSSISTAQGGVGGANFALRKTDGTNLGSYKNVGDAKAAFTRFYGSSRILKWQQIDLTGDIEQHVAIGLPLDAADIFGDKLISHVEPSNNPGSVILSNVATKAILQIADLSGNDHTLVQTGSPTLVSDDANFLGKDVVDIDKTVPQGFTIPTFTSLDAPYTVAITANVRNSAAGNLFQIGATGTGPLLVSTFPVDGTHFVWKVSAGAASFISAVSTPVNSKADIITLLGDGITVDVRINGTAAGTIADTQGAAGSVEIGGASSTPWDGRFGYISVASQVDKSLQQVVQIERYLRGRYQ